MRSNVVRGIVAAVALVLATAQTARADIKLTGVLSTGNHTVSVVSVLFTGDSMYTFPTPGWQGDPMVQDTFVFPWMFGPPNTAIMTVTIDSVPQTVPFPSPQSDTWYVIPSTPEETKVKFVWVVGGVGGHDRPGLGHAGLTVSPSIVGAGATVRAERVAGTSCVFEFFDAAGNRVRTLRTQASSGAASATWAGEDDLGRRLPEGIYYCCLGDAANPSVRKLILTR